MLQGIELQTSLAAAFAVTAGQAVALGVVGAARLAEAGRVENRIRERLRRQFGTDVGSAHVGVSGRLYGLLAPLWGRLSKMLAGDATERAERRRLGVRRSLIQAGIYAPDAARLLMASRIALAFVGVFFGFLISEAFDLAVMLGVSMGGGIGYVAPMMWLRKRTKANQQALSDGLPDGLDLMVVCVEAGLTIDAAMQRVGEELALAHPVISREFSICHMETRVGVARGQALRNLGDRTGFVPLQSLAAMLVQAERFGTSIATALRIQADGLRVKRQTMAEEAAAKASVKLTFPLVLFIFPASFIVMAGPIILRMMNNDFFTGG